MRIKRSISRLPMVVAFAALVAMPLGAHAARSVPLTYYGPDNSVASEAGPCLRGGTDVERSLGGVCFNVLASDKKVGVTVADASTIAQQAEFTFFDTLGEQIGSGDFCSARAQINVPLDATYLEVRLVPQIGVSTFGGACPPQTGLPPQYHGVAIATTGTITANFS